MDLARRLTRVHRISAFGKQWGVVFTHGALLEIEEIAGVDVLAGGIHFAAGLSAQTLRAMLYVVLKHAGAPITEKQAGDLLRLDKLRKFRSVLWDAWRDSMPEPGSKTGSEDREPLTWMRVWASARQGLGVTDAEWLAMTPRMVQALHRARVEDRQGWEWMLATLTAATVNFSMCHPKERATAMQFMVHPWEDQKEDREAPPITGEYLMAGFAQMRGNWKK